MMLLNVYGKSDLYNITRRGTIDVKVKHLEVFSVKPVFQIVLYQHESTSITTSHSPICTFTASFFDKVNLLDDLILFRTRAKVKW